MSQKPLILQEYEYHFISDQSTGHIKVVKGPARYALSPLERLHGSKKKMLILTDRQYVYVKNVWDPKTQTNNFGTRELRKGPANIMLYPMEERENVCSVTLLQQNQAAIVKCLTDFDGHKAGDLFQVKGPGSWIPSKNEQLVRIVDSVNVSESEAIYVRDNETSVLKMINGPVNYILKERESLYKKQLSGPEYRALSLPARASWKAYELKVRKNECVCIVDYETSKEKYLMGPISYLLKPHEGVKVVSISAGVPKKENQATLAIIRLGPDFMTDRFQCRTKDNAVVQLEVSYQWRFILDDKTISTMWGDFAGYSCQSLRSRIREEISHHPFEKIHSNAVSILRDRLFKQYELKVTQNSVDKVEKVRGRFFSEFNFLIFDINIKSLQVVDKEIAALLDQSLKSSMMILCNKLNDNAEIEAKKDQLDSEIEIELLQSNVIKQEHENYKKEHLEKAKIDNEAILEKARSQRKAKELIERSEMELELKKMQDMLELLKGEQGKMYIDYIRSQQMGQNVSNVTVVPSGMKTLWVPQNSIEQSSYNAEEESVASY